MSFMSGLRRLRFRSFGSFGSLRSSRSRGLVCQEVVELVTDYLEGALSPAEHSRFEEHLSGCPHCTEYLAQMRETIRLAGRLAPEDLTPAMRTDLTDLYRRWRAED
jgi:anti-sigma factor RsiW